MNIGLTIEQLALFGITLLIVGYVVLGIMALIPATRVISRELIQIFFSATLIALVLISAGLLGTPGVVLLVTTIAFRVGYEATQVRVGPGKPAWTGGLITTSICLAAMLDHRIAFAFVVVWPILLFRLAQKSSQGKNADILDLLVFPILPMALMTYGAVSEDLRVAIIGSYVLVEIFDSCALLFGKLFGKRKAFPILSPRKTIEGLVGALAGMCTLTVIGAAWFNLWLPGLLAAAIAVAILAVAGDLAASRLKRMAGIKDYPILLKHQGGLLDSLDSWLAASAGLSIISFFIRLL